MIRPIAVKAHEHFKIWLRYSDQTEGTVELSHLVNRGVFKMLKNKNVFESVYITDSGSIAWGDDIELCPDTLYMKITGKKVEEVMPGIKTLAGNA
jgi:hypothetical protein